MTNARNAFCSFACFESYYRKCCIVCERPFTRKAEQQRFCRQRCKSEFHRHPERFLGKWVRVAGPVRTPLKSVDSTGVKTRTEDGRGYRLIAGPILSETALQFAALPLDAELARRLDRQHQEHIESRKKAKRTAARKALIKCHHPPLNIIGGFAFPGTPTIDLSPIDAPSQWAVPSRWAPRTTVVAGTKMPAIPDFLLGRDPAAASQPCRSNEAADIFSLRAATTSEEEKEYV
jgi:hypothetical protein